MDQKQALEILADYYGYETVRLEEDGYLRGTGSDDPYDRTKDDDWFNIDRLAYCEQGIAARVLSGSAEQEVLDAIHKMKIAY